MGKKCSGSIFIHLENSGKSCCCVEDRASGQEACCRPPVGGASLGKVCVPKPGTQAEVFMPAESDRGST